MTSYGAERVAGIVHRDPCGGMRRDQLERKCGLRGEALKVALMIAYRKGWIGFVRGYVVATRPEWSTSRG